MSAQYRVALADGNGFYASADETLLSAAQRAHWLVRYGCRNGNCNACVATLLGGTVQQRDVIIDASSSPDILLCLSHAQSDLHIALASNPLPGDADNAQRLYARIAALAPSPQGYIVNVTLPAGRKPTLLHGQFALLEIAGRDVRADIDSEHSRGRELILHVAADIALTVGEYVHLRYPLGGAQ